MAQQKEQDGATFNISALPNEIIDSIVDAVWQLPARFGRYFKMTAEGISYVDDSALKISPMFLAALSQIPGTIGIKASDNSFTGIPILALAQSNKWFHKAAMERWSKTPICYINNEPCPFNLAIALDEGESGLAGEKGLVCKLTGALSSNLDDSADWSVNYCWFQIWEGEARYKSEDGCDSENLQRVYNKTRRLILDYEGLKDFTKIVRIETSSSADLDLDDPNDYHDWDGKPVFDSLQQITVVARGLQRLGWTFDVTEARRMKFAELYPDEGLTWPTTSDMVLYAETFIEIFPMSLKEVRMRREPIRRACRPSTDDKDNHTVLTHDGYMRPFYEGKIDPAIFAGPVIGAPSEDEKDTVQEALFTARPWTVYETCLDALLSGLEKRLRAHDAKMEAIFKTAIATRGQRNAAKGIKASELREEELERAL